MIATPASSFARHASCRATYQAKLILLDIYSAPGLHLLDVLLEISKMPLDLFRILVAAVHLDGSEKPMWDAHIGTHYSK